MSEQEARRLAAEISRDPQFHIDNISDVGSWIGRPPSWSIRFTILYSRSTHWVNSPDDWEWVKRNLTWHPKGGWTPESEPQHSTTAAQEARGDE